MTKRDHRIITKRERIITERLERNKGIEVGYEPMFQGAPIRYEMSEKSRSTITLLDGPVYVYQGIHALVR